MPAQLLASQAGEVLGQVTGGGTSLVGAVCVVLGNVSTEVAGTEVIARLTVVETCVRVDALRELTVCIVLKPVWASHSVGADDKTFEESVETVDPADVATLVPIDVCVC